ncbi:5-hydroxytryptamine receptor 1-like protein, partial [Dinothrombium tinctorium]
MNLLNVSYGLSASTAYLSSLLSSASEQSVSTVDSSETIKCPDDYYIDQPSSAARILFLQNDHNGNLFSTDLDMMNDTVQVPCSTPSISTRDGENNYSEIAPTSGLGAVLVLCLCLMMAAIIFGNILVCLSVILVRKLRHPSNYLLISLAIADLCVGILVTPLGIYLEMNGGIWNLGHRLCDVWISFDQCSCTASILNLCVICIDRYLAITQPLTYGVRRTTKRILTMIIAVWVSACLISVPPLLVFGNDYGTESMPTCGYSQNLIYQLYATLGAFYIPLVIMLILYYKIYVAAKKVIEAEQRSQGPFKNNPPTQTPLLKCAKKAADAKSSHKDDSRCRQSGTNDEPIESWVKFDNMFERVESMEIVIEASRQDFSRSNGKNSPTKASISPLNSSSFSPTQRKENIVPLKPLTESYNRNEINKRYIENDTSTGQQSSKRRTSSILKEQKASITLGVIMTAFIVCWLPFFIMALLRLVVEIPHWATSLALWLGFANSMLNPIIYVTFHQDFRKAFRYLLCLQCRTMNTRLREEAYQTQYGYCDRI